MTATYLTDADVDAVKAAADLVQVIGEYVRLRKTGRQWTGVCPFHTEKTGSFKVTPARFYKCFGCGATGDVITFVKEMERISFRAAVELLAERYGIPLRGRAVTQSQVSHSLQIAEECAYFWQEEIDRLQKLAGACFRCQRQAERFVQANPEGARVEMAWWWSFFGDRVGEAIADEARAIGEAEPKHLMDAYLLVRRSYPKLAERIRSEVVWWGQIMRSIECAMLDANPDQLIACLDVVEAAWSRQ